MTADRPTTEPRPTPAYVKARQFYNERNLPQPYYDLLTEAVAEAHKEAWDEGRESLRRETEAAQGAAPLEPFDNTTEACRHCPTPDVHPMRIGGVLTYEGRCDPDTCEKHDHSELSEGAAPRAEGLHCEGCAGWAYEDGSPVGPLLAGCPGLAAPRAEGLRLYTQDELDEAVRDALDEAAYGDDR